MARILILREEAAARRTAMLLANMGHASIILPLETTRSLVDANPAPSSHEFDAFALTSARAVPALATAFPGDPRPLFAVGNATAVASRKAGFPRVVEGQGTGEALGLTIADSGLKAGSSILYAAGRKRTGTLEAALSGSGFPLIIWEVYATKTIMPSTDDVHSAIAAAPDAVLILSQGQAKAFGHLLRDHPAILPNHFRILALSERIAEALPHAHRGRVRISPDNQLPSLVEALD